MGAATTLFRLAGDRGEMFDGSVNGISILNTANAKVRARDAGIAFDRGFVDVRRHKDLDALQSFTIEAVVTPTRVGTARQNIAEAQTPSVALFIEANGKLVGSVHTAAGWVTVDSGATLVKAGAAQRVTFARGGDGKTELQIDGKTVGTGSAPGAIVNVGALGFRVGMGMDGQTFPFAGTITDLSIRQGVVTQAFFSQKQKEAQRLEGLVKQGGTIKKISVRLLPDESHARLQHVKDIMNAAGVETLSDLDTLPVRQRTPLARGQVLVAPNKTRAIRVNWAEVAKQFRAGDIAMRRDLLATQSRQPLHGPPSAAELTKATPLGTPPGGLWSVIEEFAGRLGGRDGPFCLFSDIGIIGDNLVIYRISDNAEAGDRSRQRRGSHATTAWQRRQYHRRPATSRLPICRRRLQP
jgi:hypothetical protein